MYTSLLTAHPIILYTGEMPVTLKGNSTLKQMLA